MPTASKSIVFITGTFISNNCWDEWIELFQTNGFACIAPAWPYKDAPAEELRNRPANDAAALNTTTSLTNYFSVLIQALPEKPILIGHSLGGLVVQILLQRGLAIAAVALHSFPPAGINSLRFAFRRAVCEAMAFFSSPKKTYLIPFSTWRHAIANGMDYEQQKKLYYLYAIPESKRIIREAFSCVAKIDFSKPHAPLLFTSGSRDNLIPSFLNYFNYKKYTAENSTIEYREFQDHPHLIFGHPAGQKEAEFVLNWVREVE